MPVYEYDRPLSYHQGMEKAYREAVALLLQGKPQEAVAHARAEYKRLHLKSRMRDRRSIANKGVP